MVVSLFYSPHCNIKRFISQYLFKTKQTPTNPKMDLSYSLDILFMLLAVLAVRHTLPSYEQMNATDPPSTPRSHKFAHLSSTPSSPAILSPTPHSPHSPFGRGATSLLSPIPKRDSLAVPQITLTPELRGATRPKHGRKSVSFSLSSMDELIAKKEVNSKKRPPTPFARSYYGKMEEIEGDVPLPALPRAVEQIRHNAEGRDAMGVKKGWLMPRGSV